jgi:acetyl-CoA carboxylase beta subunit
MIDMVVDRRRLKPVIADALRFMAPAPAGPGSLATGDHGPERGQ